MRSNTKAHRSSKKVTRYAPIASENTYKIGKTQKMVYDIASNRQFTQRQIQDVAKNKLGLFPSETERVMEGMITRGWFVPLKGRKFKKGNGRKPN